MNYAQYADADLALQAAVLAHALAEGQVFVDGNKRTALIAMDAFLEANGYALDVSQETLAAWMVDLSTGLGAEELADRLRGSLAAIG